ncbi:MAG: hypothetical protein BWX54_01876 [Verrucomicrobia bacterium ADurb.Bin018]|nr:MAG: hypothetical protein BWX54_01876 [Verrucomicrobia bacterium ADurb.Bin018]
MTACAAKRCAGSVASARLRSAHVMASVVLLAAAAKRAITKLAAARVATATLVLANSACALATAPVCSPCANCISMSCKAACSLQACPAKLVSTNVNAVRATSRCPVASAPAPTASQACGSSLWPAKASPNARHMVCAAAQSCWVTANCTCKSRAAGTAGCPAYSLAKSASSAAASAIWPKA